MTALIGAVFVASLLGSLHCAAMCGGIVALCVGVDGAPGTTGSGGGASGGRRVFRMQAAYSIGRLLTYSALGGVAGAVGAAFDLGGSLLGVSQAAAIGAGALMIMFGLAAFLRISGFKLTCARLPRPLNNIFQRAFRAAATRPGGQRAFLIGLLTGFLPCGWLYAFVIAAAGTGSAAMGALTMAVFWSGTLPVMVGLGVGVQKLTGSFRKRLPAATALLLVFVGVLTVVSRINAPAFAEHLRAPTVAKNGDDAVDKTIDEIDSISETTPACCRDEP